MKYLYVEMVDSITGFREDGDGRIRRRIVKIELTLDQIKMLKPKFIGRLNSPGGHKDIYEDMHIISIQDT